MRKDLADMVVTISQMTDRSDLKVLKKYVVFWKFSFLQICKKKFAKIFGMKNCS